MKPLLLVMLALLFTITGLIAAARGLGWAGVETPFSFAGRAPLPDDVQLNDLLPIRLGTFDRVQLIGRVSPIRQSPVRLTAYGAAIYARPNDAHGVYIELKQYSTAQIAALLINPDDWRLHTRTFDRYYVDGVPTPFVFTAINNGYHEYTLEYVRGRWNVTLRVTNSLDGLLALTRIFPY